MTGLLYRFCGNESFVNYTLLYQDVPVLTECFLDTLPVWIACGFLWLFSAPFVVFMVRTRVAGRSYSVLHVLKMTLCLALACLVQLHFTYRQKDGDKCEGSALQPDSGHAANWITFATFVLAAALIQVQKNCGILTSGVPFFFWLSLLVAETFRLYSYILAKVVCGTQVVFYVYYGVIVLQFVLHCWAEKEHTRKPHKITCPMDVSSILNRITFHWLTSLVYSVYKKTFTTDKMWEQTARIKSTKVGPRLQENWQRSLQAYGQASFRHKNTSVSWQMNEDLSSSFTEATPLLKANSHSNEEQEPEIGPQIKRPNLFIIVLRTFICDISEFFAYGFVNFILYILTPMALKMLIDYIEVKDGPGAEPPWVGVAYIVVLCLLLESSSIMYNITVHHSMSFGLKVKSALMYVIYKKALTAAKTKNTMSVGEVSSLMSVDCQRIQDATMYGYYILLFAFAVAGFTWQVIEIVGVAATLAGLGVMFILFPTMGYMAYLQNFLQKEILETKGLRVRVINEVLTGIKVLKMYAWEPIFRQKIEDIRLREHKLLHQNAVILAIVATLANNAQYFIHFAIIAAYVIIAPDHYVSSSVVFVSMSLVVVIKAVVTWLPTVLSGMVQIILLEGASRLGGWMHTVKSSDGGRFELGPHSIRPVGVPGKNTLQLADEIGLAEDVVGVSKERKEAKNRYLYVNGKVHPLPSIDKLGNFFKTSPPFSKSPMAYFRQEFLTKGDTKHDESIYDFMARRLGPDIAEYGVDAFCRGIFAGDVRELSIKSCFPMVYDLEKDYGGIVKGAYANFFKNLTNRKQPDANECGLIKKSKEEFWSTYTFKRGCQQLPDRIHEVLGSKPEVEIHINTRCSGISFKDNYAEVNINGEVIKADHVVSSVFSKDIGALVEADNSLTNFGAELRAIPGVDVVVVCLEYEGTGLIKRPGFGHLLPSCEDRGVLGVIYDSCMFPELDAPNKQTTRLTAMMGGAWYADLQKAVPSMSEAELGKFAAEQVSTHLGIDKKPTKTFVAMHMDCIPQYKLGHSDRLERIFNTINDRNLPLSLVGSSYRGPSINDCINNTKLEVQKITGVTV